MWDRPFVLYLGSRFCAATAMTLLRAAIMWHVFAVSQSAFHLGLIGLAQFVPVVSFALLGGAVADRYDRRRVMLLAEGVAGLVGLGLWWTTAAGTVALAGLYAAVVVVSTAGAFNQPARAALLPTLVPRAIFPRAVTVASTNQALAFVTGPALAGVLIAAGGIASAYAAYAALLAGSAATLLLVRVPAGGHRAGSMSLAAIREGLAYVRRHEVVLGCMTLDMLAVIFGGATALLPVYANEILGVGARGYGVLSASLEIGALVTSMVLAIVPPIRRAGRVLLLAVGAYGVATVCFGLSRWFPLSVAFYMLAGVADQVSVVLRTTAIQLETPDELRGRVSSVSYIFIGASNQLGAVESGFVAALTTATFSVVSGGVACLLVVLVIGARFPRLRRYEIGRASM